MTKIKKIRYCLAFTAIVFVVSGLWYPILCGALFSLRNFIVMGFASIATVWGGAVVIYLLARAEKEES